MQVSTPIPHINQENDWDCGLACVAMVANALGARLSLAEVAMHCKDESVWTIDLAYILRKLSDDQVSIPRLNFSKRLQIPNLSPRRDEGWDFTYYTSTIGADAAHSREKFYRKSFDDDQKRVNALFDNADAENVRVIQLVLPLDDFKRFLYCRKYGIITLVNQRLLSCLQCLEKTTICNCTIGVFDSFVQRMKGFRYIGHFILLVAYEPNTDMFYYRDPAVRDDLCSISASNLERARSSNGTDHDCIVVKVS
ncbi:guanylyl cyclase domain-containing protein 1 [Lobosporangium transversale]|uniref:Guanylylate cyclase-domain-containing protein n=1 Tax=Lobosporangium transversale TaxID=64571 RepID=A0A1Y2GL07_9FUNG|nr:Guanylylate cyclase-domain-containing protein [Lobosporangium transversale]KAF9914195.1 guanylyl cyclase domain-containing protein 1 [Lobosporangium transversale]ORZ12926.1 Guanylylate cyclase-domain-containing protein [Lobosporangium transversale]|eukprot:XP_021880275.1 Guanylylate cyclase-domain-containing protein [Lobosporangium transversale]